MTESMKQEMFSPLSTLTDCDDTNLLSIYIEMANDAVLKQRFPFGTELVDAPSRYKWDVIRIASYLFFRRGSEGELSHSENGVSITYSNADIPQSMLSHITPCVGVFEV